MWEAREQRLTATARLAWPVLGVLRAAGCNVTEVLGSGGLSESDIYTPDARIRLGQLYDLWNAALEATGDDSLGIKVAGIFDPDTTVSWPAPLSIFEHMIRHSPTLIDAVALQSRFLRLTEDGMSMGVEITGDVAVFRMDFLPGEPAALVEFNLATACSLTRRATGWKRTLKEVWFTHPAPADVKPHQNYFGCPVRFGAPFNATFSDAEVFRRPIPDARALALVSIVRHAQLTVDALPSLASFEDRVCAQIEAALPRGNTNASAVAEALGVSSRTLHRKLATENVSYQALLDRVRLGIASRCLIGGQLSIVQVSERVGFSQPSTFHRAFKTWTGLTPSEYQQRHGLSRAPEQSSSTGSHQAN